MEKSEIQKIAEDMSAKIGGYSHNGTNILKPKCSTITWSKAAKVLRSGMIKNYMIILFVVPLLAKVLVWFDGKLSIHMIVPFSVQVLYCGVLLLFVAKLIFNAFCPSIIRDYDDFHDTVKNGMSVKDFLYQLEVIRKKLTRNRWNDFRQKIIDDLGLVAPGYTNDMSLDEFATAILNPAPANQLHRVSEVVLAGGLFNALRKIEDNCNRFKSLYACYLFLSLGLLCLAFVFIQNAFYVFRT